MNPKCRKVIISTDAFNTIIAESMHKHPVETGGILLGQIEDDIWYVIESIEPGPESIFKAHYFEYDHEFVNYLANARARRYKKPLKLLGLWHRHPGSFDSFSSTDDETNLEFARRNDHGAISGLVNIDPELRFTLYHFDENLKYKKVSFEVSDEDIPFKFFEKKYKNQRPVVGQEPEENEVPEEILNILIRENEILEKQKIYDCSFEMTAEDTISYSCICQKQLLGKELPKQINWDINFSNDTLKMTTEKGKVFIYREGVFLNILFEEAGLDVEEKNIER